MDMDMDMGEGKDKDKEENVEAEGDISSSSSSLDSDGEGKGFLSSPKPGSRPFSRAWGPEGSRLRQGVPWKDQRLTQGAH
ncbi:hypothetical protein EOD39_0940 [Acipenser ruthenus]|uniref:Uncharacterized protein n=1 Tax=Acipenser ruthenus TaxID=7906 RepID=A0A444UJG9_ACIRT|nr:hypothetical protein EOD39_0940 [Acipenser ruthenus]